MGDPMAMSTMVASATAKATWTRELNGLHPGRCPRSSLGKGRHDRTWGALSSVCLVDSQEMAVSCPPPSTGRYARLGRIRMDIPRSSKGLQPRRTETSSYAPPGTAELTCDAGGPYHEDSGGHATSSRLCGVFADDEKRPGTRTGSGRGAQRGRKEGGSCPPERKAKFKPGSS